jgi:hypothetical protein
MMKLRQEMKEKTRMKIQRAIGTASILEQD